MIYDINGVMVEILDERFPAVNIQVWEESPELHFSEEHGVHYGIYFEMLFESGTNLIVTQEAVCAPAICDEKPALDHFLVEETHRRDGYRTIHHTWHCQSEEELLSVLRTMKKNFSSVPRVA